MHFKTLVLFGLLFKKDEINLQIQNMQGRYEDIIIAWIY